MTALSIIKPDRSIGQTRPAAAEGRTIAALSEAGQSPWGSIVAANEPLAAPIAMAPAAIPPDSFKPAAVESAMVAMMTESHRAGCHAGCESKRDYACENWSFHRKLLNIL